jgi:hypothetical protein
MEYLRVCVPDPGLLQSCIELFLITMGKRQFPTPAEIGKWQNQSILIINAGGGSSIAVRSSYKRNQRRQ